MTAPRLPIRVRVQHDITGIDCDFEHEGWAHHPVYEVIAYEVGDRVRPWTHGFGAQSTIVALVRAVDGVRVDLPDPMVISDICGLKTLHAARDKALSLARCAYLGMEPRSGAGSWTSKIIC